MNASDYGGGAVVDIWRRDVGIGVGHIELEPKLVSLPVSRALQGRRRSGLRLTQRVTLGQDESIQTFRSFVAVHRGDYFHTLRDYRDVDGATRRAAAAPPRQVPSSRSGVRGDMAANFTAAQVEATLPIVKKLGFGCR